MANVLFPTAQSQKVTNIWNTSQGISDEGTYFVATNPTPGTPIATTTSITADSEVNPVMLVGNTWNVADANAKNIYPMYLRMILSQVPTFATSWQCTMRLDNVANKYTSGGSTITPVNINSFTAASTKASVYFGAITAVTGNVAAKRLIHRSQINSAVPVTLDQWMFTFGDMTMDTNIISGGAGAKNLTIPCSPVVIGPGWWLEISMFGASNAAAPSWEFEFGYIER